MRGSVISMSAPSRLSGASCVPRKCMVHGQERVVISRLSQSAATSRLSNIAACVAHKLAQPSASWRSGGCFQPESMPQAAPSSAPPRPTQPLGPRWPASRPCRRWSRRGWPPRARAFQRSKGARGTSRGHPPSRPRPTAPAPRTPPPPASPRARGDRGSARAPPGAARSSPPRRSPRAAGRNSRRRRR